MSVIQAAARFRRYPADRFAGLNNDLAEPSAIPSWDAAADAIGDRYASVRAIRDEQQREFMREAFAATRPDSGEIV